VPVNGRSSSLEHTRVQKSTAFLRYPTVKLLLVNRIRASQLLQQFFAFFVHRSSLSATATNHLCPDTLKMLHKSSAGAANARGKTFATQTKDLSSLGMS
jgi:hypothetical protein